MRTAILTRNETGQDGTFGDLVTDSGYRCIVVELPWRGNRRGRSCIPAGKYLFARHKSPKHGYCYQEWDDPSTPAREDVPDRENIQIHSANLARQLLGCLAPGKTVALIEVLPGKREKGVTSSKATLAELQADLGFEAFELEVCWRGGSVPPEVP